MWEHFKSSPKCVKWYRYTEQIQTWLVTLFSDVNVELLKKHKFSQKVSSISKSLNTVFTWITKTLFSLIWHTIESFYVFAYIEFLFRIIQKKYWRTLTKGFLRPVVLHHTIMQLKKFTNTNFITLYMNNRKVSTCMILISY